MKKIVSLLAIVIAACGCKDSGMLSVNLDGIVLMSESDFGISTSMRSWDANFEVVAVSRAREFSEDYTMPTGKRSHCTNTYESRTYTLVNTSLDTLLVELRRYSDGFAFRYAVPHALEGELMESESTTYHIPAGTNRWMQKYTGPGYEQFFPNCPDGISPEGEKYTRWGYPALFEVGDKYLLVTESDILRGNCSTILSNSDADRNSYRLEMLDSVGLHDGWVSPWRVLIYGSLSDVVESTLVTDVATPNQLEDSSWVEPGVSSWIYWAYNHGSQECSILKEYVDLAAEMGWPYTLVDAEWDVMRGGDIREVVDYAAERGVKPMIWYNSTTGWYGDGVPTPQGLLNDAADRETEFAKIATWGTKGVKIDFFSENTVDIINYYIDLLEAGAKEKMLVNFHGGTIPCGWQRTFPNFITCEAVYGAEWYNNKSVLTDKAACHNATLPFTRNVIGSMDYTPGTFTDSQHPHITTHAHELALTVLFESGIQHMPDRPSAYRSLPEQARWILSNLPTAWDDTRLLAGYPGESVVLARRKGNRWYVAGINGRDEEQTLDFSLGRLGELQPEGLMVSDGASQTEFSINENFVPGKSMSVTCSARGGFVLVIPGK